MIELNNEYSVDRIELIGIYCIRNTVTNKVYIGQSKNIITRWNNHISTLRKGNHPVTALQLEWNQYGENAFVFSVIKLIKDNLLIEEDMQIKEHLAMGINLFNSFCAPRKRKEKKRKANIKWIYNPLSDY